MLGWWLPDNLSTDGTIFHLLYWSSAIAMLTAQLLLARTATRGARLREIVWALVPVLLLLSLGALSHRSPSALAASRQEIALEHVPSPASGGDERHGR
jgi:hypothetical protein